MTKADREEFDRLMWAYRNADHYGHLALSQVIDYKMCSKREALELLRRYREEGRF